MIITLAPNTEFTLLHRVDLKHLPGAVLEAQRVVIPSMRKNPYWRLQVLTPDPTHGLTVFNGVTFDTRTELLENFHNLMEACVFLGLVDDTTKA